MKSQDTEKEYAVFADGKLNAICTKFSEALAAATNLKAFNVHILDETKEIVFSKKGNILLVK